MYVKILKYNVFSGTKQQLMGVLDKYNKVNIVSGNPEVLYTALENEILYDSFKNNNAIIIPDGIGTVIASKIVKQPVKEKIAGIEVMEEIIRKSCKDGKSIYLLGSAEDVVMKCRESLLKKYPGLRISGFHDGYFDLNNCDDVLDDIKYNNPYVIFVAMGCPRQETFIAKYMDRLPCRIYMGVGGSFDVIAGNVKRAPSWMVNLGLEWLYRVTKEPWRIKRLKSIPKFLIKVVKDERR